MTSYSTCLISIILFSSHECFNSCQLFSTGLEVVPMYLNTFFVHHVDHFYCIITFEQVPVY